MERSNQTPHPLHWLDLCHSVIHVCFSDLLSDLHRQMKIQNQQNQIILFGQNTFE